MPNPVTNAYTGALNGIIKFINKTGRGYKFNALRAKILFSEGAHKIITPKFNRRPASSIASIRGMLISEPGADYQIRDHGVDMHTLVHILEDSSLFPDPHYFSDSLFFFVAVSAFLTRAVAELYMHVTVCEHRKYSLNTFYLGFSLNGVA